MSNINDGGPAFPFQDGYGRVSGMTLRDWFASQAMAGLVPYVVKGATFENVAEDAYKAADAMLRAREVKP
jgi:hypothetical protein